MPTVDIQVPMVSKKTKPVVSLSSDAAAAPTSNLYRQLTGASDQPPTTSNEQDRAANSNKTLFNFVVMTKKGNKTQYHNMEVPVSSEFAQQFRAREEVTFLSFFSMKPLMIDKKFSIFPYFRNHF